MSRAELQGYHLSIQQAQAWSVRQSRATACVQCALLLDGPLEVEPLRAALMRIVADNEILRTTFQPVAGLKLPVQVISEDPGYVWRELDLPRPPAPELIAAAPEIDSMLREEQARAFDYQCGPLIRACLLRFGAASHVLALTISTLCADSWTLVEIARRLFELYEEGVDYRDAWSGHAPIQYADFAEWQDQLLHESDAETGNEYWRRVVKGLKRTTLPFERRSALPSVASRDAIDWRLDPLLAAAIDEVASIHSTTASVLLLACWQTLLWRMTESSQVVVGLTYHARENAELEMSLGPFSKALPIKCEFEKLTFDEALNQIDEAVRQAVAWQDYLDLGRLLQDSDELPGYLEFGFEFCEWPRLSSANGVAVSLLRQVTAEPHKLKLSVVRSDGELASRLEYDAALFDRASANSIARRLTVLVGRVVAGADRLAARLDLLDDSERSQLLAHFAPCDDSKASEVSIPGLFEQKAGAAPDALAVVCGDAHLSYQALNRKANQCAHHLKRLGISSETTVGILLERGPEVLVAIMAVLKARAAYVFLDTGYPKSRLAYLVRDTRLRLILSSERLLEKLVGDEVPAICLDRDLFYAEPHSNPGSVTTAGSLAYIAYTSGSTGDPKGILSCHGGVVNYLRYVTGAWRLNDSDVVLQLAPFTFDASLRDSIGPLRAGASVVVPTDREARDPAALLELINRHRITRILSIVPTMLRNLVAAANENAVSCGSVRTILLSGEQLYAADCQAALTIFGGDCLMVNQYGPTECTMTSTYHAITKRDIDTGPVLIGKPIPNSRLYVLGPDLDLAAPGIKGEVYIGGAGLARGYLNRPDLTAERFLPDPLCRESGARIYDTGDLAYYTAAANVDLAGRKDHQVKIRGVRVELAEIEAAMMRHPVVREVAAVAASDGLGEKTLLAYYTSTHMQAAADLRDFLREQLPEYLLPSAFIQVKAMPLTRNGKVDRNALAAEGSVWSARPPYVAPRTDVERKMAGIWAELLGVERVGLEDNFFDLGGHSLRATSLLYKVQRVFLVDLPLRSIFDYPALGEFCSCLVARQAEDATPDESHFERISRRTADDRLPLSFAQQRLWFLDQLEAGSPGYNLSIVVRLSGKLRVSALSTTLDEIVNRHESLRTRFPAIEGEPIQVIEPDSTAGLIVVDVEVLGAEDRELAAARLAGQEAARPFNLAEGPLFKCRLFRLGETEHLLLIAMHHIVSDLWSIGILVRELAAVYTSLSQGFPSPLSGLQIQYADFALWQREWMRGKVLESHLAYWERQLAGLEPLDLPTDRPRPPVPSHRGAREALTLAPGVVGKLDALGRQEGATLYMVVLAAFQLLIHRYTGREDIAVGSPTANRNSGQVEDVVGSFANTLVLRTDLSGDPSFRELVQRVKTVALAAYAHQDVPFEKLVEVLQPERDLRRNPLFQVLLALQNVPVESVSLPGLELQPIGVPGNTARFDLALWLVEGGGSLGASLEYSTDLFDRETAVSFLDHFQVLAAAVGVDPDQKIGNVPLLTDAERSRQLFEWNHVPLPAMPVQSIDRIFEAIAERYADSTAVVGQESCLTFRALDQRANQLANHLRRLGVCASDPVGVCLDRSVELIVAMLGALKAGGAYVPLDPVYPAERLAQLVTDSQAAVVLADERTAAILPPNVPAVLRLDAGWSEIALESSSPGGRPALPDQAAYVIFTSGSAGRPKGVTVSHRNVVSLIRATDYLFDNPETGIWTLFHSYSFDLSAWEIWRCLLGGSRLIVVPDWVTRSPAAFYDLLCDEGVTVLNQTPSALRHLISAREEAESARGGRGQTPPLRLLFCGGEALPGDLACKSLEWKVPVWNLYGPTEATVWASIHRVEAADATCALTPVGRPLPNAAIHLLDGRRQLVPRGVLAELCIAGLGVSSGYLNLPKMTAEQFVPDPLSAAPGRRLYRTGDTARRRGEEIEYLGRIDNQLKIRGYRVEAGEIESVLASHPAIHESLVMPVAIRPGETQLAAYVVFKPGQSPAIAELRGYLRKQLPDYMIPTAFVELDALPLTPNGKIDRKSLAAPERVRHGLGSEAEPPRTFYEAVLAGIWAGVLGLDEVGIHDNFFDLGGHSLLAPAIVSKAKTLLRVRLPLRALFESPTVAGLARAVEEARRFKSATQSWTPVVELQRGTSPLPFFCVHAGGGGVGCYLDLVRRLGSDQTFYGIQAPEHGETEPAVHRFDSVEEMAACYAEAVRVTQPEGPYLLGGWSAGGVIAFEMAHQLKKQGQEVALLALFDCMPRSIMASKLEPGAMAFLYAKAMAASSGRDLPLSFDSMRDLDLNDQVMLLVDSLKRAGILPHETKVDWFRGLLDGVQARSQSLSQYSPAVYPGKITLFRGRELDPEFIKAQNALDHSTVDYLDTTNGWSGLSSEPVEVYEVPGHHYTIVLEPHVGDLARQLRLCIGRALEMISGSA